MLRNELTIFVSSSDSYEDCWRPFFSLFAKHWRNCDIPIVLNTQSKDFAFPGLDITCTKTGQCKKFGEMFHAGLDHVRTENILLIMIDYFLVRDVNLEYLQNAYNVFLEEKLDGLILVEMKTIDSFTHLREDMLRVQGPGPDRFTFQIGFWKKSSIRKYVLRHEDPWLSEYFGSLRYRYTTDRLAFVKDRVAPFTYPHSGAIHKGGWIQSMIPFLEGEGHKLDWSRRGLYEYKDQTLGDRISKRFETLPEEFKSRMHLLGMKLGFIRPA